MILPWSAVKNPLLVTHFLVKAGLTSVAVTGGDCPDRHHVWLLGRMLVCFQVASQFFCMGDGD